MNFARNHSLPLAVRGGGHNIAGSAVCDDGIVIDLSQMKAAQVDAGARRISIEGGATLADFDATTQAHGLATPLGMKILLDVWRLGRRHHVAGLWLCA